MRCQNPPLTTPISCVVSMPIIVRILTAGTDIKGCRIAIVRMNDACEKSPLVSSTLINVFAGLSASPTCTPYANGILASAPFYGIIRDGISCLRHAQNPKCLTVAIPSATGSRHTSQLSLFYASAPCNATVGRQGPSWRIWSEDDMSWLYRGF